MTIVTRPSTSRDVAKAPVALTRTRLNTAAWVLRTAVTPRRKEADSNGGRGSSTIALTRTTADTVRWVLRDTRWGMALLVALIALAISGLIGLWLAVPLIDAGVATAMDEIPDALRWLMDLLAGFPAWLASLFPGAEPLS